MSVAEVRDHHDGPEVVRTAAFSFPENATLDEPEVVGAALAQFLREGGFRTRRCVVGLPARWFTARRESVPPVDAESLAGILRIRAEEHHGVDCDDLVHDYLPARSAEGDGAVVLCATPRRRLNCLLATMKAARLKVRAVTSSAIALAALSDGAETTMAGILYLGTGGSELVLWDRGMPLPRYLGPRPEEADTSDAGDVEDRARRLANDVERLLMLNPRPVDAADECVLSVIDAAGEGRRLAALLDGRLPVKVRLCERPGECGLPEAPEAFPQSDAAAVATIALGDSALPLDFINSRLQVRHRRIGRRPLIWACVLIGVAVIAIASLVASWRRSARISADLRQTLASMEEDLTAAEQVVERFSHVRGWYDRRPHFMDCMRALTLAFPREELVWATTLDIGEDMRGSLLGKADSDGAVLALIDSLRARPEFVEVKPLYVLEENSREAAVSFALSFSYVPSE